MAEPQDRLSFCGLPAEVRIQIYRLCLIDPSPITIVAKRYWDPKPWRFEKLRRQDRLGSADLQLKVPEYLPLAGNLTPNLIQVCRTVYAEASSIFYGFNRFRLRGVDCWEDFFNFDYYLTRYSHQHISKLELLLPTIERSARNGDSYIKIPFSQISKDGLRCLGKLSNLKEMTLLASWYIPFEVIELLQIIRENQRGFRVAVEYWGDSIYLRPTDSDKQPLLWIDPALFTILRTWGWIFSE